MLLSVRPHFSFTPTGSGGVDAIFNLTHFIFHLSYHIDMDKPLMFQLFNVNYSPYICHLPFSHINSLICHFHFLHIYICMWVTIWHFASYFHFSNLLLLSHLLEVECASTLTLFITMCGWQFLVFFHKEGRKEGKAWALCNFASTHCILAKCLYTSFHKKKNSWIKSESRFKIFAYCLVFHYLLQ